VVSRAGNKRLGDSHEPTFRRVSGITYAAKVD
jgi:hypothetical protein